MLAPFPLPAPGDLLWCRFPEGLPTAPGSNPRPGLGLAVGNLGGQRDVMIAFGTSQKADGLYAGEFLIEPVDGLAYRAVGLS